MFNPNDFEYIGGSWVRKEDVCPACNGGGDAPEGWDCEECDGEGVRFGASQYDEQDLLVMSDDDDDYEYIETEQDGPLG